MNTLSDATIIKNIQESWLPRVGDQHYMSLLEALVPAAVQPYPSSIELKAGPHQRVRIEPAQYMRVIKTLARDGDGIEGYLAQLALH